METKKEIRNYCKNKLNALVRDHNHYNKVKYKDAVEDYRTAIGDLVDYAKRNGIKIGYTMDENGYITVAYVEYLFEQYQPYMWWVLLATAGVWSVVMGVFFGIAAKNEDKEKARKMIKNYVIGLVVIAVILVACPYLVRGIAALIAG